MIRNVFFFLLVLFFFFQEANQIASNSIKNASPPDMGKYRAKETGWVGNVISTHTRMHSYRSRQTRFAHFITNYFARSINVLWRSPENNREKVLDLLSLAQK